MWIVVYRKGGRWRINLDETTDQGLARRVRDGLEAEGYRAVMIDVSDERSARTGL